MRRAGIDGTVLVQAADNIGDTRNMLAQADRHAEVLGVMAWIPLDDAERSGPGLVPALDR